MSEHSPVGEQREAALRRYVRAGGPYLSDPEAARRLNVTPRTISRYKVILRERGLMAPARQGPVLEPGRTDPGWCMCGCGRRTRKARPGNGVKDPRDGWCRYVAGHSAAYGAARAQEQRDQERAS